MADFLNDDESNNLFDSSEPEQTPNDVTFQHCLEALRRRHIPLLPGTTPANFVRRLLVALTALEGRSPKGERGPISHPGGGVTMSTRTAGGEVLRRAIADARAVSPTAK